MDFQQQEIKPAHQEEERRSQPTVPDGLRAEVELDDVGSGVDGEAAEGKVGV